MPRLLIDDRSVEVAPGSTILDAAKKLAIDIPTLCSLDGRTPSTSCMACVVRLKSNGRIVPSCATVVEDGMEIESETPEVRHIRRANIELLLGNHTGDCEAPCRSACPAGINIPRMVHQIARGEFLNANVTAKRHVALPAVLGRICPAPCEKACRRGRHDEAVAICLLKRFVAEVDLHSGTPYMPPREPDTHKHVAIVGAGPAGLSAAYYLLQKGHHCVIFDEHPQSGGALRYGLGEEELPRDLLDAEINIIRNLGAEFRMNARVNPEHFDEFRADFDAVLLAFGEQSPEDAARFGVETTEKGVKTEATHQTSSDGIFACGSAARPGRMAVRSIGEGRTAADAMHQHLSGSPVTAAAKPWTVRMGKLREGEMEQFLREADDRKRTEPARSVERGFCEKEAQQEARRCLHCDCRAADDCRLREYAEAVGAKTNRGKIQRPDFRQDRSHPDVIYEPGKCIRCGLCVQVSAERGDKPGLSFVGRGFSVQVAGSLGASIAEALRDSAAECIAVCPTGALAWKND